jgi:phosphopantetheine adenylyltransferase
MTLNKAHEKEKIDFNTGEIKTVNANFIQLYEDKTELLIKIANNSGAMKLFLWLITHMDDKNAIVVSQEALSKALNVSRMTINRSVNYLKEEKILTILKSGGTNIYAINSEIAWKDDANSKKYAHFTAKVYVTREEQETKFKSESFAHAIEKKRKELSKIKKLPKEAIIDFESESIK